MGQERFSSSLKPSDAMCPYVPAGRSRQNSKPPMKLAPHYHLIGQAKRGRVGGIRRIVLAGDRRFVPDTILGSFDTRNWREQTDSSIKVARKAGSSVVDVAASLMRMWQ